MDDRRRSVRRFASGDERRGPLPGRGDTHVEDERAREAGQGVEIESRAELLFLLVAGDERYGRGLVALRNAQSGVASRRERGRDAWNDLERDAGGRQGVEFLGEPAEDCRIAPFEPHDRAALPSQLDHAVVDLGLRHDPVAPVPAEADQLGVGLGMHQDAWVDQVVV